MKQYVRVFRVVSRLPKSPRCFPKVTFCRPFHCKFVTNVTTPSSHLLPLRRSSFYKDDTIIALSTPPGRSAIAIIRISGPDCLAIHSALCPNKPSPIAQHATLRTLIDPTSSSSPNAVLDSCLVLYFPAPRSSTGEDTLELHVHGSPAIIRATLRAISSLSKKASATTTENQNHHNRSLAIRFAEPGEFTRRAVLNGRLDLTEAESLGELLASETEMQRVRAVRGSGGSPLTQRYEQWRSMLLDARGDLEALIDFADDQQFSDTPRELVGRVTAAVLRLCARVRVCAENARRGELVRRGIRVALLGRPNVGKSSLLNLVVGREAAIVSAEAGTTRDVLDVLVDLGGFAVWLEDLAGVRDAVGEVEREGVRRAKAKVKDSEVVVVLLAFHQPEKESRLLELKIHQDVLDLAKEAVDNGSRIVVAVNKVDIHLKQTKITETLEKHIGRLRKQLEAAGFPLSIPVVPFSCHQAASQDPSISSKSNLQAVLDSLISQFQNLTKPANHTWTDNKSSKTLYDRFLEQHETNSETTNKPGNEAEDEEIADSIAASERQHLLLVQTAMYLDNYLDLVSIPALSNEAGSDDDDDGDSAEVDLDVVLAAEHLRSASDCLARITGRGDAGDVEYVLGVVFEKFCVGK